MDERFDFLGELRRDWDSFGGEPIDLAVIQRAKDFAASMIVVPCLDGGVQLEWHRDGVHIEIMFEPDGEVEIWVDGIGEVRVRAPAPRRSK